MRPGLDAPRLRLDERAKSRQPSLTWSEFSSAVRPAPEPFGRAMVHLLLTAGSFVVMFAPPTALYEPSTLVPLTVTTWERPFITSCVVSEPTPESCR